MSSLVKISGTIYYINYTHRSKKINNQQGLKQKVAAAALEYISDNITLGVGTGTTVNELIPLLPKVKDKIKKIVASSNATAIALKERGFIISQLPDCDNVDLYIDGADCYNDLKQLIKGKGGALTREKILAVVAEKFICIAESKKLDNSLTVPIPIEVIPMARSYVSHEIIKLGGDPILRTNFVTDNGNLILDVSNLNTNEPIKLENTLNQITGIVCHGLFASRAADIIISA